MVNRITLFLSNLYQRLPRPLVWLIDEVEWMHRVCRGAFERFYWDNGLSRAASLAYNTLLSLIPFTAVVFGWIASFGISQEKVDEVRRFLLLQFIPDSEAVSSIVDLLRRFSSVDSVVGTASGTPNFVLLAALVVTAIMLINSIEYTLNEVWQVHESRSIAQRVSIFCAIILLVPCLALSGYYFAQAQLAPFILGVGGQEFLTLIQQSLLSIIIDTFAFVCLYYLVPKAPVRMWPAIFGGVIAALLFGLAKFGFAKYIESSASYQQLYQTLSVIPIFLVWLYLAWCVIILGAECAFQAQHLPRKGQVWKRTGLTSGDAALVLAVQAIVEIAHAFRAGTRPPGDSELAERLGCSTLVLKPTLIALEKAGIVVRGDSRDMPWTLLRSPERISVGDICAALFVNRREVVHPLVLHRLFGAVKGKNLGTTVQELLGEEC